MEVDVKTLQEKYPAQFDKEYQEWDQHNLDYDWWVCTESDFINDMEPKGVSVDRIEFSLSYSQGDYFSFIGYVRLPDFMEAMKLDEKYPALYEAVKADGSKVQITTSNHGHMRYELQEYTHTVEPCGIFDGLDVTSFQELVAEQLSEADLEMAVREFCDDAAYDLKKTLYADYEYLTSEDSFIEHCCAYDVMFEVEDEEENF